MHILYSNGYQLEHTPSAEDMGTLAIRMLLNRIENPEDNLPSQFVALPTNVIINKI